MNDVEAEVAALKARGVVFEEYDTPPLKTVNSIVTAEQIKGAWFKDSEGNLLGIAQLLLALGASEEITSYFAYASLSAS